MVQKVKIFLKEQNDFALSIRTKNPPKFSFETGRDALELAFKILKQIDSK